MRYQTPASKIEIGHTYQAIDSRRVTLRVISVNARNNWDYEVEVIHPGTCNEIIGSIQRYVMLPENWTETIHTENIYDDLEIVLKK